MLKKILIVTVLAALGAITAGCGHRSASGPLVHDEACGFMSCSSSTSLKTRRGEKIVQSQIIEGPGKTVIAGVLGVAGIAVGSSVQAAAVKSAARIAASAKGGPAVVNYNSNNNGGSASSYSASSASSNSNASIRNSGRGYVSRPTGHDDESWHPFGS